MQYQWYKIYKQYSMLFCLDWICQFPAGMGRFCLAIATLCQPLVKGTIFLVLGIWVFESFTKIICIIVCELYAGPPIADSLASCQVKGSWVAKRISLCIGWWVAYSKPLDETWRFVCPRQIGLSYIGSSSPEESWKIWNNYSEHSRRCNSY